MEDWDAHTMAHLARVLPGPIYTYRYRVTHGLAKMLCSVHPIVEEDVPFVLGRALGDLDDPGLWGREIRMLLRRCLELMSMLYDADG